MSNLFFSDDFRSPREIWNELFRVILQQKYLIVIVQIATVLSTYGYLQLVSERYQAESQLLVKLGRQNVDGPVTAVKGVVTTMGVREEEINSNISLLSSRSLVEETVDEIGLDKFTSTLPEPTTFLESIKYKVKSTARYIKDQFQELLITAQIEKRLTPRETAVLYCHQKLAVQRIKSSDVIQVLIWMPSPEMAVMFEETLIRKYLERHREARAAEVSEDFFAVQADAFRAQMEALEKRLVDLLDKDQLTLIDRQRDLLLSRLHVIQQERDECQDELDLLKKSKASRAAKLISQTTASAQSDSDDTPTSPSSPARLSPEMISSGNVSALKDRILQLHLDKSRIVTSEGENAPSLPAIDSQLRRCETQMEQILLAKIAQYQEHMSTVVTRLSELNDGERLVEELTRDRDLAERNYLNYIARMEDSRISRELDRDSVSNVSILTPPIASANPVYPKKRMIVLMSIVAGLLVGIGLALTREYFDDTIRSTQDKSELDGWEILGNVQLTTTSARSRARNRRPREPVAGHM